MYQLICIHIIICVLRQKVHLQEINAEDPRLIEKCPCRAVFTSFCQVVQYLAKCTECPAVQFGHNRFPCTFMSLCRQLHTDAHLASFCSQWRMGNFYLLGVIFCPVSYEYWTYFYIMHDQKSLKKVSII